MASVGFGLADSPAGPAAWIHSFVQDAAQDAGALDLDELIDDIMMYWLPNAGASAARLYWEVNRAMKENGAPTRPQPALTGISAFPGELGNLSRRWAAKRFAHLVHFNEPARGGHFAAWEAPDLFIDEVRATFRSLR
ncbi:hypothetical protein [Telluria beijingensis]|uniref:hypothetical protein n=1 Tax=Telluria beijingensis TaxID=3068633 RepID=UPI00279555F0|nr:hypothetical protein [Massilia sp. REN29]